MSWTSITTPPDFPLFTVPAHGVIYVMLFDGTWGTYDPLLDSYSMGLTPAPLLAGSAFGDGVYDSVTDAIYWFRDYEALKYDIVGDSWTSLTLDPFCEKRSAFACGRKDRQIIFVGGYDVVDLTASVTLYDIDGDSWTDAAPLPRPLAELSGAWVSGKFYTFGGGDNDLMDYYGPVELAYTLATDSWTELAAPPYDDGAAGAPKVLKFSDSHLLFLGGFGNFQSSVALLLTPPTTWTATDDTPFPSWKQGSVLDDVAYIFATNNTPLAAKFSYTASSVPLSDVTVALTTIAELLTSAPVSGCDNVRGIGFQDILNETGFAKITFQNDDPDLALIVTPNTLVNFYVLGELAFTTVLETWEAKIYDRDEEKVQATLWNSRGHKALFERGIMYPALMLGSHPIEEDRGFNWSSAIYDDSAWIPATRICSVLDAQTGSWPLAWDTDFADPGADVVGPSSGSTSTAPTGACYIRQAVEVYAPGTYEIQCLMDNLGELYVDGSLIMSPGQTNENPGQGFLKTAKASLELTPGLHSVAMRVFNVANPPSNIADPIGATWTLCIPAAEDGGSPTIIGSCEADFAIIEEYPSEPPGMTPGKAILVFLGECQVGNLLGGGRGALTYISTSFDEANDSNGTPWPVVADIATKVGTTFLTFLRELSATYIDFYMAPGTLVLDAFIKDSYGTTPGIDFHAPTDEGDESTGNIASLDEKGEG